MRWLAMCTFFYVDGFNLYYVALKGAPWNQLLASIRNGFHLGRFGKQLSGEPPYAPIRSPVFAEGKGVITAILIGGYAWMAADEFDAPFSDGDRELLANVERLTPIIPFGDDTGP